jgi:hypothetical protein
MTAIPRSSDVQKFERISRSNELVTEDQAAIEFAEIYSGRLRFCHSAGSWFEWTGTRW